MRKIFISLAAVFAFVVAVMAAAPITPTITSIPNWDIDAVWYPNAEAGTAADASLNLTKTTKDTLVGADTLDACIKYKLDHRYFYAYQIADSTSSGDTIRVEVRTYDIKGNLLRTLNMDTLAGTGTASKSIGLEPSAIGYCHSVSIRVIKWIATIKTLVRASAIIKISNQR